MRRLWKTGTRLERFFIILHLLLVLSSVALCGLFFWVFRGTLRIHLSGVCFRQSFLPEPASIGGRIVTGQEWILYPGL